jgi:murein DD-endopeptidase MepM/ murein hydrolase activator NlpD
LFLSEDSIVVKNNSPKKSNKNKKRTVAKSRVTNRKQKKQRRKLNKEIKSQFYEKCPGVALKWPLKKNSFWISSHYGRRRRYKGKVKIHEGIDLAASSGTRVMSAEDGNVIFAGLKSGYGKVIVIKHKDNIKTIYAHLSKIFVSKEDYISRGSIIGLVGATGNARGRRDPSHLHFELIINDKKYNPLLHLTW